MAYDITQLINEGVKIIYGGSKEERDTLAEEILQQYPEYRFEINKKFFPKKVGPFTFKVNKTVYQIMLEDDNVMSKDITYLSKQIEAMDCNYIVDHYPRQLSLVQRERASVIIDAMNKKKCYLFNDSDLPNDYHYMQMSSWLFSLEEFNEADGRIIWITFMDQEHLLNTLHENYPDFASVCKYYNIENGKLNYKANLYHSYAQALADKQKAQEAARKEKAEREKAQKTRIEKAQAVRRQVQQKTEARLANKTDKPENIVIIEELIYECSMVPLAPHRLEGLMELLKEANSAEHYEQFIEVIKMYLLTCQEIYGESDVFYEDALEVCEKEMQALQRR